MALAMCVAISLQMQKSRPSREASRYTFSNLLDNYLKPQSRGPLQPAERADSSPTAAVGNRQARIRFPAVSSRSALGSSARKPVRGILIMVILPHIAIALESPFRSALIIVMAAARRAPTLCAGVSKKPHSTRTSANSIYQSPFH